MKILNNSNNYSTYNKEQHIQNLKELAALRSQADSFGTGTMGVGSMIQVAAKAAMNCGITVKEIAEHLHSPEVHH